MGSYQEYVSLMELAKLPGYWSGQDPEEFSLLLDFLGPRSLKRVLEIGTHRGGTMWALAQIVAKDAILVSVDDHTGSRPDLSEEEIVRHEQSVHLVYGDSHDPETAKVVRRLFRGDLVDFLLIDGDHTYDGASADWRTYSPLVRSGGFIALHDIQDWAPENRQDEIQVWRLWTELRKEFPNAIEFCRPDSAGIGLIRVE